MIPRLLPLLMLPALASLTLGTGLQAQGRCVDSLTEARWRSTPLRTMVMTPAQGERNVDRYVDGILPLLAQRFRDPSAELQAPGMMVSVPTIDERMALGAQLLVRFDRRGKVLGVRLLGGTGIAALDSAIVLAGREAGGEQGFGRVPRKFRGDTLSVTLAISDRHPATIPSAPLGAYSTSYLVADVPPRLRTMPPARASRGRRGRQVTLAATVDPTGKVEPSSIRVVGTNDPSLVALARSRLARALYRPGTRRGCPAESYIRQVVTFP